MSKRGFTLTEMMIVVAILGLALMMARVGINIFNSVMWQKTLVEGQRDAQTVIYAIAKEIRNCQSIVGVSDVNSDGINDGLTLLEFDFAKYGFDQTQMNNLRNPNNLLMVEYGYIEDGSNRFLQKTIKRNSDKVVISQQKFLRNLIVAPTVQHPIFSDTNTRGADAVLISLQISPIGYKGKPIISYVEAMKRTT